MTICYQNSFQFPLVKRRKVELNFEGGDITSNAGVQLLSEVDRRLNLCRSIAGLIGDQRRKASCEFSLTELIQQRVYALALGYEDLNDHNDLRHDLALQTAVSRDEVMASAPTLHRFEQRSGRETAVQMHEVLFEQFIQSYNKPPKRLILDFDATNTPLHGEQEDRFFHGYYDQYCYLPLYVFCDRHLLVSYLRPSNIDGAKHSWAILSLLVKALRSRWPKVDIIFRGDSGFCRWKMLSWCEKHNVNYIVGIAKNTRLLEASERWLSLAEECFQALGTKQRIFSSIYYAARNWKQKHRVIVKAEHSQYGSNPRFVITNLEQTDQYLYDKMYCARGDMENRIKDQQLGLFADRTSCQKWWPNQFRQLLSGLAYVLLEGLRRLGLEGSILEKASPNTIRIKLLLIGAVVLKNTRRIKIMMSESTPSKTVFAQVITRLNSS